MQDVPANHSSSRPLPLLEEIRQGGKLTHLFRQASLEQSAGTRQILRQRRAETLLQSLLADARERQQTNQQANSLSVLHECAAGCSACCLVSFVDITPLEALAVAEYVKEKLSAEELATLRLRLKANAEQRLQWRRGRSTGPIPACVFLGENGLCRTYEARPLVCAGVFSFSKSACDSAMPGPSEMNVPMDREAKAWTAGVSGGMQQALVAAGLDANLYELHSAVLCALETEEAFERWWKREDIFLGCHCTDAHSFPRKPKAVEEKGTKWRIDKSHLDKKCKNSTSHRKKRSTAKRKKRMK